MTADSPASVAPKLRFPEFRDAPGWSTLRGDTLFDSINNRNAAPGLPVLAITQEYGAIPRDQIDYHVSVTEQSVASYKEVCEGDFIISLRSFQGGIEYSRYHGICSPAYVILRRKGNGTDQFFRHFFKSDRFIQQQTRNIEGIRDGKMISYAQFSEQLLPVPSPSEQQKIADCLDSLDDLIAVEGRNLEALRQHKQGLMQRLFPQPGEARPRLRFSKFEGSPEWKGRTIAGVCDLKAGDFVSASEIAEHANADLFPCYGGNGLRGYVKSFTHDGRYVLIGRQGALCGNVNLCAGKFHATEHALVASPKPGIDSDWLFYALDVLKLNRFSIGQAQPGLSVGILNDISIAVPIEEEEQKAISDCLASLDTRIGAQVAKLDALKRHKMGLLQQLFPSLEV